MSAYDEGFDAALAGASETTNPYSVESDEHLSWNDGFMAAEQDMH